MWTSNGSGSCVNPAMAGDNDASVDGDPLLWCE
jgi:hypothetical protein